MADIDNAKSEIYGVENTASENSIVHKLNTTVKLIFTVVFVCLLVSVPKYDVTKSVIMCIPVLMLYILADISIMQSFKRIWAVFVFLMFMCIGNMLFNTGSFAVLGGFTVTYGMLSAAVLLLKGVSSVLMTTLLIESTGMEKLCSALLRLHFPNIFVTELLLTYRYIFVLLRETKTLKDAYSLRAPKDRGLHFKVWGTLVGQLLIRSIDRANEVYNSMVLRGFSGAGIYVCKEGIRAADIIFIIASTVILCVLRFTDIINHIGGMMI